MPLRWRGSWQRSSGPRSGPVCLLARIFPDYANSPGHNPNYDQSQGATLDATYLLPHLHDLEALKVVQSPPLLHSRTLLGPCALVELLLDLVLLPLLRDVADTAGAGKLGDDNGCQRQLGERDFLAGNGGLL